MDWYKAPRSQGGVGARFTYTIELRDDFEDPHYGFLLPPDQIIPSGQELWAAERAVFMKIIQVSNSGHGAVGHDGGAVVEGQVGDGFVGNAMGNATNSKSAFTNG